MFEEEIASIKKHGITAKGRTELLNHLGGKRITLRQAVSAKCFECMGYFADGRQDCGIKGCPLYPWMVYGQKKKSKGDGA